MYEHLHDDTIFFKGEVRHIDDLTPEEIDESEDAILDGIISGIHPHEVHERQTEAVIESVMNHPSTINSTVVELGQLACNILDSYHHELVVPNRHKAYRDKIRRDAVIAIVRNRRKFTDDELRILAHELGYSEDHFVEDAMPIEKPEDDWAARQFKD